MSSYFSLKELTATIPVSLKAMQPVLAKTSKAELGKANNNNQSSFDRFTIRLTKSAN